MKLNMYSVYDTKSNEFSHPYMMPFDGMAERVFADQIKDDTMTMGKNPQDFSLFKIGEIDTVTGKVKGLKAPKEILQGIGVAKT